MKLSKFLIFIILLFNSSFLVADSGKFKIGVVLPLSGNLSFIGKDVQRGMLLAKKDLASISTIRLIFEDGKYDTNTSLRAAKKLIQVDKVHALVSLWDMADIVATVSEKFRIPHLAIRWNSEVAINNEYTFTFEATYQTVVREQVGLLKDLGFKSISILASQDKSTVNALNETIKVCKEEGIKVNYSKLISEFDESFNTFLLRAVKSESDVVMFWFFPPYIELSLKKSKAFKMKAMPFGMFNDIPKEEKHLVNGLPFVRMYKPNKVFTKKFITEYGENYHLRAPHGYDVTMLLANAFSLTPNNSTISKQIIGYLNSIKDYQGVTGLLNVNKNKSIETGVYRAIVENGKVRDLNQSDIAIIKNKY